MDRLVSDDPVRVRIRLGWTPSDPSVYRIEIGEGVLLVRVEEGDRVWEALEALERFTPSPNGTSLPALDPWGAIDSVPDGWDS